ncbi:MAG: hypothetical protein RLZZ69_3617 [Cyanobacteriota bacterium]|jgi:hypothetical protein
MINIKTYMDNYVYERDLFQFWENCHDNTRNYIESEVIVYKLIS